MNTPTRTRYLFSTVRERVRGQRRPVLDFAFGSLRETLPRGAVELVREQPELAFARCSAEELEAFVAAAAAMLERVYGLRDASLAILPAPGGRAAMSALATTLLAPGDGVLVTEPTYPAFARVAAQLRADVHAALLDPERGFAPDLASLTDGVVRNARILALNFPNNPTGAVPTPAALAEIARQVGPQTVWFNDAVYGPLTYDGAPFSLLAGEQARDGRHFMVELHSLTKLYGLGPMAVSFLAGDASVIGEIRDYSEFVWPPLTALQVRVTRLCLDDDQHFANVRENTRARVTRLRETLDGLGFATYPAAGGIYLLCATPAAIGDRPVESATHAAELLLSEHGLSVVPWEVPPRGYLRFSAQYLPAELETLRSLGHGGKLAAS